jgi:diguanylate cyclase (GGDEF)-like protein
MRSRYGTLAAYSALLACAAITALALEVIDGARFPAWWVVLIGVGANLFVWQFGLRAPRLGLISMERVPQIGLLLVFEPAVAASICAGASLIWPLVSRRYSQGSLQVAALRGIHNAAMTALMLLLAGKAYLALGGQHPLAELRMAELLPLTAMALVAQMLNIVLMALFFQFDGREVRRILTPGYALSDLIFVPAGVLAAVLFNAGSLATFVLFASLMVLFVLSFNSIGVSRDAARAARTPLTRLFAAGLALQGARHIDELAERILAESRTLFRFDQLYVVLVDRERRILDFRLHERLRERMPPSTHPIDAGLFGWLASRAEPLVVKDWRDAPPELRQRFTDSDPPTGSMLAVPLVNDGIVLGLLCVQHTQPGIYADGDLNLIRQLGEQVAGALADARAFEDLERYRQHLEERVAERTTELERASAEKERLITMLRERSLLLERETQEDALTGIANRRCFLQRLAAEIDVALAVGQPLSIAIVDLDHFKVVNDELGHAVGDRTLRQIAALMRRTCRQSDLVARIGGEEFALILPGMTRQDAAHFCESLRAGIAAHDWRDLVGALSISVSVGVAQWDGTAEIDELVHGADTQLYRAKRAGRNQVA